MKKRFSLSAILSICFGCAAIVLMFTACTPKSPQAEGSAQQQAQPQTAAAPVNPYPEILNGDLSAFAGMWVNGFGRIQFIADGTFGEGSSGYRINADGTFDYGSAYNFELNKDGTYSWYVSWGGESMGYYLTLFPPGVEIIMDDSYPQQLLLTDTTKVRIADTAKGIHSSEEVYYREGEAPRAAASFNLDAKILAGDLSDFEGTWVNNHGDRWYLNPDGTSGPGTSGNFTKSFNGIYSWSVSEGGESGYGAALYPAGTEVWNEDGQLLATDTTKIRITMGYVHQIRDVFYREGEAPAENDSSAGDPNGQWRFESGGNINFFGHEFITISPNGHIEIWGIRPGESYLSGGAYTKETAFWEINDGGELAVYHESGVNGVFYFSIAIRDDVMNITDQNGNSAVFHKVYLQ